jgi:CHAT domain-containing protein
MKVFSPRRISLWLALLVLTAWPAAGQARNAQSCLTADQMANYAARLEQIDEKLLAAADLSKGEAFALRSCRVQTLIDAGNTIEAADALAKLREELAGEPQQAFQTQLLTARLAARNGQFAGAAQALETARLLAGNPDVLQEVANVAGLLARRELPGQPANAATVLDAIMPVAETPPLPARTACALRLLAARIAMAQGDKAQVKTQLDAAERLLNAHPADFPGDALVTFGQAKQEAGLPGAARWYLAGADIAGKNNDQPLLSRSMGLLGSLSEQAGQWDDALAHTRAALLHAQAARDQELIFTWQWQQARILRGMRQLDGAIAMNRMAVETLQGFRADRIAEDPDFFRTRVRPAYLDLAELLLTKAAAAAPQEQAPLLRQAAATIELLRSDELKDYLKLPCLPVNNTDLLEQGAALQQTAILYLIDFDDHIGMIVRRGDTFLQFTAPVSTRQVKAEAFLLAKSISRRDNGYRESAERLYRWLLAPLEAQLPGIDTLIIVPDGATRSIPFAALFDGRAFLVEKYAVVMNQGLSITTTGESGDYGRKRFFLGGISEAVATYNAIPRVADELQAINRISPAELMQDRQFTTGQIKERLQNRPHPVVHLASHGQFSGDSSQSFILTWDGRLNIEDLSDIVKSGESDRETVDLITLSACSTAVGDDRAALGLAGVALKAGARSAVASLWNVDDEATERFFVTFYTILQSEKNLSKAAAIRATQLQYLSGAITADVPAEGQAPRDFSHPFFWAPFVLTGNWH